MVVAHGERDGAHEAGHLGDPRDRLGGAAAELAEVVAPPAVHRAVAAQGAAVARAELGVHHHAGVQEVGGHGVRVGEVPELALVVAPPAA